jgi:hypothetical protein
MNDTNTSVSIGIRILGILSIIAGILVFALGGGALFSMISKQFMAGDILLMCILLILSGLTKIISIFMIWKIKKTGITIYAISEIFLLFGLVTEASKESPEAMIVYGIISAGWSVLFIVIYGMFIKNKLKKA